MSSFFTPAFIRNLFIAAISGLIISFSGFRSEGVHVPFLFNMLFSVGLGWLEPKKGWALALMQVVVIFVGYYVFSGFVVAERPDVAKFATYLAAVPTLAGSFMGAFMKRAFL
ncbi:hypothetical protein [Salmonirosea aquatica]|uniref:Uncharacterized protein n=1 Tax=Salmonirosea aquatica TaxID=2654236 RepID=A0A7C9BE79_9BACT|nr:hypothetical protein [Cytophagaceae bacterium SJW1-29]